MSRANISVCLVSVAIIPSSATAVLLIMFGVQWFWFKEQGKGLKHVDESHA